MTTRRNLLIALGASALGVPGLAGAQAPGRRYRLGWISVSDSQLLAERYYVAFVQQLASLGFVEGRNLTLERRFAEYRVERLPALAAELAALKCDAFFGSGSEASLAALTRASRDTPIVFIAVDFDPVATGDVSTLARPGGRVTGVTTMQSAMPAKRLELLRELLPAASKVAILANDQTGEQLSLVQGTARRMGINLHVIDLKRPPFNFEAGFAEAVGAKVDAVFVLGSGLWVLARRKIPELALKAQLPSVFHASQWAETGGLISYGFDFPWMFQRGADMVASVLRGVKPGDIPMQQPTKFELAVNLKTANALGLKIPQSILVRADRVFE